MSERVEDVWEAKIRQTLDRIPGYRGYRLKEDRREADRRVRDAVADAYAAELARVERIGRELANARQLGAIGAVERASQAIRHYVDRVSTASPGYGGLFGERDVDGVALDQLRLFDEGLMLGVDELQPAIARLEADYAAGRPLAPAAGQVATIIESQLARLDTRQSVIETGRAASRDSVLSALQPIGEVVPHAAFSAQPGDAISILGDDHLVDARIDVDGQPKSFRLLRIDRDPEEWLLVGRDPASPLARLRETAPSAQGATIPGETMQQIAAGTGDGEITGEGGSSGLRAVRYALLADANDPDRYGLLLDWDGERQAFVGNRAEPLDIEVFRRTETAG